MSCCHDTTTFQVGDAPRLEGTFEDKGGNKVDPATVTFEVKDPSGNVDQYVFGTDPQVIRSETGVYFADIDADEAGTWYYRFFSTGSGKAAGESSFTVDVSHF